MCLYDDVNDNIVLGLLQYYILRIQGTASKFIISNSKIQILSLQDLMLVILVKETLNAWNRIKHQS